MITTISPSINAVIDLQTSEQYDFLSCDDIRVTAKDAKDIPLLAQLAETNKDCSKPNPVTLEWSDTNEENITYTVFISENEDLSCPIVVRSYKTNVDVYNLKAGKKYYWVVKSSTRTSNVSSFSTKLSLPRYLRIRGVTNFRDVGGYKIPGGYMKQNILFRGAQLDYITPEGMEDFLALGIKTEIDLRFEVYDEKDSQSMLKAHGIDVDFRKYPIHAYGGCFSEPAKPWIKKIFETLADENNYPIFFHCAAGADRTGSIAFLVQGIMGVDIQDMINDYEITSISHGGVRLRTNSDAKGGIDAVKELCVGNTWQELCRDFLTRIVGISEETLNKITAILTEKA